MLPLVACIAREDDGTPRLEEYLLDSPCAALRKLHDARRAEAQGDYLVGEYRRIEVSKDANTRLILVRDHLIGNKRHQAVTPDAFGQAGHPVWKVIDAVDPAFRVVVAEPIYLNAATARVQPTMRVGGCQQPIVFLSVGVIRDVTKPRNNRGHCHESLFAARFLILDACRDVSLFRGPCGSTGRSYQISTA